MSRPQWDQIWDTFHQLTELGVSERNLRLGQLRDENQLLYQEVSSLLDAHEQEGGIVDETPVNALVDQSQTLANGVKIGAYTIDGKIGSGGMGEVFLAHRHDGSFDQQVAIKFAGFARYSPALKERFEIERQILSDLSHPNIARLFDGGATDEGVPYLVMEYIEGLPIDEFCDQHGLTLKARLRLFLKVCDAVQFAHRNLIIHRDIKPGNILVTEDGTPKLLDFGVAKLLSGKSADANITAALGPMLTPAYASPEQLQGKNLNTASDVYTLGILLFKLTTGQTPYQVDSTDLQQAVNAVCNTVSPNPSQHIDEEAAITQIEPRLRRRLSGDLDSIILKCLHKTPEKRYASATELHQDLSRYLNGQPVLAQPDSFLYKARKLVQRHPISVTASVLGFAIFTGFSLFTLYQSNEIKAALAQAQSEQQKTQQISGFLESLFEVSDPLQSDNPNLSARDLLDTGLNRLDTELAAEPLLKASMQGALGRVYSNLSEYATAQTLLQESLDTLLPSSGEADPEVLRVRLALSNVFKLTGDFAKAKEQLDIALGYAPAGLPEPLYSELQLQLAWNEAVLGNRDHALTLAEQGLRRRFESLGPEHIELADAMRIKASVLWYMGRFDQAEAEYNNAYRIHLAQLGANHHQTLSSLSGVGIAQFRQGKLQQAIQPLTTVLERRIETLGPDHSLTADAHNRLGAVYLEQGSDMETAARHLEAALKVREAMEDESTPTASTMNNLALVRRHQQKLEEAESLFRRALKITLKNFNENHPRVATDRNNLGLVLLDKQAFRDAQQEFEAAHQIMQSNFGEGHLSLAFSMGNNARALMGQGKLDEAEQWIKPSLQVRREQLDDDNPALAESLSVYGELLILQGQLQAAIPVLEQALGIRQTLFDEDDWRSADTAWLLAYARYQNGDQSNLQVLDDAVKKLIDALGMDHARTRLAMKMHAELLASAE